MIVIDLKEIYGETAKFTELPQYTEKILELAGLTESAPVWLYLKAAHALHGKAAKLIYRSPVTGDVLIFDHCPF